jgi:hypothetical protein
MVAHYRSTILRVPQAPLESLSVVVAHGNIMGGPRGIVLTDRVLADNASSRKK